MITILSFFLNHAICDQKFKKEKMQEKFIYYEIKRYKSSCYFFLSKFFEVEDKIGKHLSFKIYIQN